jgi:hypothetical protein
MNANFRGLILFAAFFVVLFAASPAYAYLDPGTGSMMVQVLLAAVAAAGVSISIFWGRLRTFFHRVFGRKDDKGE